MGPPSMFEAHTEPTSSKSLDQPMHQGTPGTPSWRSSKVELPCKLDHNKLMDLKEFDPLPSSCTAVESVEAAVHARFEAQRVVSCKVFEEERMLLQQQINKVHKFAQQDKHEHEARIARLVAKLEVANGRNSTHGMSGRHRRGAKKTNRSPFTNTKRLTSRSVNRGSTRVRSPRPLSIAERSLADRSINSELLGSVLSERPGLEKAFHSSSKQSLPAVNQPPTVDRAVEAQNVPAIQLEPQSVSKVHLHDQPSHDLLNKPLSGHAALSEQSQVRQWGALVVGQLGVTPYATKPQRWNAHTTKTRKWGPPKTAGNSNEAFPPCPCLGTGGAAVVANWAKPQTVSG